MARNVRIVTGAGESELARQQQMADALTARSLRPVVPPPSNGPMIAPLSPWQGFAQLGEALVAARLNRVLGERERAKEDEQRNANAAMVEQLTRNPTLQRLGPDGKPTGASVTPPTDFETGQPMLSSRGEMLAAAMRGVDPRQGGKVLASTLMQRALAQDSPAEAYTLSPGQARFQGTRKVAEIPAEAPKPTGELAEYQFYADQERAAGRQPAAYNDWSLARKRAGASQTTVQMGYEKAWDKATAENDAKRLDELRGKADSARQALQPLARLRALSPDVYEGGTAQARLSTANFLNGLGFNIDPKLASSQEFDSLASQMVIASLGGSLGTGFSNADRDFVMRTIPQLGQSAQARQHLIDYLQGKYEQQIKDYNSADSYAQGHGGLRGFNPNPRPVMVYDPVSGTLRPAQ